MTPSHDTVAPHSTSRLARVRIRPRDPAALGMSLAEARAAIARGFGGAAVHVGGVGVSASEGAWLATVIIDAARSPDGALAAKTGDERLWRAFIESAFSAGACDVSDLEQAPPPSVRQAGAR